MVGATNLEILQTQGNQLTTIDVSANTKLTWLNVSNNQLSNINVTNNTALQTFACYDNEIEYLYLGQLINLLNFSAQRNNLEYLNIKNGGNKSMSNFYVKENPNLTCIQVDDETWSSTYWASTKDATASFNEDCNDIWEVYTEDASLDTALKSITGLDSNNDGKITYKEAQDFTGDLDLSGQNITSVVGLEAFSNALSINVSRNNLKDISYLFDTSVTLISKTTSKKRTVSKTKSTGIKILNASDNLIQEINLSNVTTLTSLNISNNKLTYININNNSNEILETLIVTGNSNLTCIQVDDVVKAEAKIKWVKDANANYNTYCEKTTLSTNEFLKENIIVYPNPVNDFINITLSIELQLKSIDVYNLVGKKIKSSKNKEISIKN